MARRPKVAVVGAGVTGLASALYFYRAGFEVVVFESSDRLGGKVDSVDFSGRVVDTGPDTLGPSPAIDDLLDQLGMDVEVVMPEQDRAFRLTAAGSLEPFGVGGGVMFGLAKGIASLPERLGEVLQESGVSIRLESEVERIVEQGDEVLVVADGHELNFEAVLVATGARVASTLVDAPGAELLAEIRGLPVCLIHLAFPTERIGREMNGTGYLADPAEGRLVTGCSWSSVKWKRLAGEPAILRASIREVGQGEVIELSDQEVIDIAMAEIGPVMKISEPPVEAMVNRHSEALTVRDEQHESAVASARKALETQRRIKLAGADLDGPGISRSIDAARQNVQAMIEGISK